MKYRHKKILPIVLLLILGTFGLSLWIVFHPVTEEQSLSQKNTPVTLEILTQLQGVQNEILRKICTDFTEETGIAVNYSAPAEGYEEILKTRMAANDMPDIWDTHGWAVRRYREYLLPLNDEEYASHIRKEILPYVTDSEGNLCTLPVIFTVNGLIYNNQVLEKAGISPQSLITWDDLTSACEKISAIHKSSFAFGGKDSWALGCFLLGAMDSWFTDSIPDIQAHLLSGTFNWEYFRPIGELLKNWVDNGYVKENWIFDDYSVDYHLLATGETAFSFRSSCLTQKTDSTQNVSLGILPYPARNRQDQRAVQIGENFALSVSKNSSHIKESLQFLSFVAKKENLELLAKENFVLGLDYIPIPEPYQELMSKIDSGEYLSKPIFDRAYLPEGMWESLYTAGQIIQSKQEDSINNAIHLLQESYDSKTFSHSSISS